MPNTRNQALLGSSTGSPASDKMPASSKAYLSRSLASFSARIEDESADIRCFDVFLIASKAYLGLLLTISSNCSWDFSEDPEDNCTADSTMLEAMLNFRRLNFLSEAAAQSTNLLAASSSRRASPECGKICLTSSRAPAKSSKLFATWMGSPKTSFKQLTAQEPRNSKDRHSIPSLRPSAPL